MHKRCYKCESTLALTLFGRDKSRADGFNPICKPCASEKAKEQRLLNPEGAAVSHARYRAKNKDSIAEYCREKYRKKIESIGREAHANDVKAWRSRNPEKGAEGAAQYRARIGRDLINERQNSRNKMNPERRRQHDAKIRAKRLKRCVAWADDAQIAAIYDLAEALTRSTGVKHHVDHEIPLVGKLVSGLHVHQNLCAIPAVTNMQKGNRFEVCNG